MNRIGKSFVILVSAFSLLSSHAFGADEKSPAGSTNLAKKTDAVASWRFEQHEQAKGTIAVADGAIVFDVASDDGTDWHIQAFQTPLDFKDGQEYVVTFKAKADVERAMKVQAGIDAEDYHPIGLDEEVTVPTTWKDFSYTFTAASVTPMKNRLGFVLGMAKGKVHVKDLEVKLAKK